MLFRRSFEKQLCTSLISKTTQNRVLNCLCAFFQRNQENRSVMYTKIVDSKNLCDNSKIACVKHGYSCGNS